MGITETYLPVRITELVPLNPAPAIGLILGVYGALTTLATWLTGRLVDRVAPARLFWPAMVLATAAGVAIALSPVVWLAAVAMWVRSVPVALTGVVLYAHLAQVVSREERAPVMSLTPVPRNLAQFSLPLLAAAAANVSTGAALAVGAVVYAAAGWVGWLLARSTPTPETAEAEDK
jgi:MFS family permease